MVLSEIDTFPVSHKTRKETSGEDDVVLFMDATHLQHNPVLGCGWIKRGEPHYLKSNNGRRRLNINGAIEPSSSMAVRMAEILLVDCKSHTYTCALIVQPNDLGCYRARCP
ncbi:MAG: hypothetical protein WBM40_21910 [Thiohalocapsa sp.]